MVTRIVVPDAGQTTDEMLIAGWRVAVGDEIAVGDSVADIETDKAVLELESHVAGHVLALMAEVGDTVTTGQTLLWVGEAGDVVPEETQAAADELAPVQSLLPMAAETPPRREGGLATPAARTLARAQGLDLTGIIGSGPDGCIVKRDVVSRASSAPLPGTLVPLSPMRRAIAARLRHSVQEAPHFYVAVDVDMTHALALRQSLPTRVTINDLIVKACADALADCPGMNCRLEGDAVRYLADINIGIAVSRDEGIVVPVLTGADRLSLTEVAARSRELVENARTGKLSGGAPSTFTVSNLGMYGVKWFTAIINPPEAAILAVGAVEDRLALVGSSVIAVPTLALTLSSDHRIVDGQLAARFLKTLKDRLESPAGSGPCS